MMFQAQGGRAVKAIPGQAVHFSEGDWPPLGGRGHELGHLGKLSASVTGKRAGGSTKNTAERSAVGNRQAVSESVMRCHRSAGREGDGLWGRLADK